MKKKKNAPRQKIPPGEKKRLYLVYDETTSGGDICEGQENDAWPDHKDEDKEVIFRSLHRSTESTNRFFYDSFVVDDKLFECKNVFLAVIRYSSGGTFGKTNGCWHAVGIFKTRKQAKTALEQALAPGSDSYKPWVGFFEHFENTEIHLLDIVP